MYQSLENLTVSILDHCNSKLFALNIFNVRKSYGERIACRGQRENKRRFKDHFHFNRRYQKGSSGPPRFSSAIVEIGLDFFYNSNIKNSCGIKK